ncbi:hypothetical protein [Xenorhabdus doucetiae]|uniref:Uncharacterized protein n=1 Tax=Xenorhabdus doucetiae TaxID=351671 RepID=A0A068QR23_9GAMM|nr:hypothetical protein [Xenorhabdus doucetiae]CDG17101.1 protein of unknown function [Xenorhabdus doucetiae]
MSPFNYYSNRRNNGDIELGALPDSSAGHGQLNHYSNRRNNGDIELGALPDSSAGHGQLPSSFQASAARGFEHPRRVGSSPNLSNFNSLNAYPEHSRTEMPLSRRHSFSGSSSFQASAAKDFEHSRRISRSSPNLSNFNSLNAYPEHSRTEMPLSRSHSFSGSPPRGYEFTTLTLSEVIPELITKYNAEYVFIKLDVKKLKTLMYNADLDVRERKIVKSIVKLICNEMNSISNDDKIDRYHKLYDINYKYPPFICCNRYTSWIRILSATP